MMSKGLRIALNVTVGFVPLILYWSLAGEWSLYAGAIAAVLLTLRMIYRQARSISTIYLVGYMLVMNTLYLLTHWTWILSMRHVISYLALALLAFGSIYFDKPYTLYEARKAYTKSFETSPLFLEVNILVTQIWGVVYGMAALLRMMSHHHAVIMGIHVLIAGAVFASIKIPDLMPEA